MSESLLLILAFLAIPAALLAALLWRNYSKKAAQRLSTCGETCHPGGTLAPEAWFLGPVLRGFAGGFPSFTPQNKSVGMPPHPSAHKDGGFVIELLPWAQGHLHYATYCNGPLTGKKRIRVKGRIEAEPGVQFATDVPGVPGHLTLYFQRRGDDWSTAGEFETYRWWASFAALMLTPGPFEIIAPLDGDWTATQTSSRESNPEGFAAALREASCVGFTTGGGSGWGHGMAATGPARLIVDEFVVEALE